MSILINDGRNEVNDFMRCDIGEFVISVEKLKHNTTPVFKLVSFLVSILKWERPVISFLCMISSCYILLHTPVLMLLFVLLPLPPFMLVELVRGLGKQNMPSKRYQDYFVRKDEEYQHLKKLAIQHDKKHHLNLYLDIVIGLQRIFGDLNELFETLQGILCWKEKKLSFFAFTVLITLQIMLYTIDTGTVFCIVTLGLFLFNKYLFLAVRNFLLKIKISIALRVKPAKKAVEFSKDAEEFGGEKVDSAKNTNNADDSESSSGSDEETDSKKGDNQTQEGPRSADNTGSMMSKLIPRTWRRRYMTTGNCSKCDQPASTILKKRRYCRHCGHSFCARCCNIRVARALLGATAPAAYQEKVLVCESCNSFLANRSNPQTEIVE